MRAAKRRPQSTVKPTAIKAAPDRRAGGGAPRAKPRRPLLRAILLLGVAILIGAGAFSLTRRTPHAGRHTPQALFPARSPGEQSLREALARNPRDAAAHRDLGRYLLADGRPVGALWHLRAARDLGARDVRLAVEEARALAAFGFPKRAEPPLKALLRKKEARVAARRALAEIALATARPVLVVALAKDGAAADDPEAWQLLVGDARFALGDTAGARAAYQHATQLDPSSAAGHDRLGRWALAAGEWEAAKAAFAAAREREPRSVAHVYRLGLAYWQAGEREAAEQIWRAAFVGGARSAPLLAALGKIEQARGELDQAAAYLVAAVQADPASEEAQEVLAAVMTAKGDRASAAYQRGFFALRTDRPHRALEEFRRMIALAPSRVDGPLMTSLAWIQMERLELAAQEAQKGLKQHPRDPRLLARLASLHLLGRNRPQAKRLCEEWIRLEPLAPEPYRLLGRIAREEQRLEDAKRFGEQALERGPMEAAVCHELSKTLAAMPGTEHARRALDLARQAAERNPREPDHWHQFGLLLRAAGQPEEAAEALTRALDLSPVATASGSLLVRIAGDEGRSATARFFAELVAALEERNRVEKALRRAVYRNPNNAAAHASLAHHLRDRGELRRACYLLEDLVALRPGDRAARRDLTVIERLLAMREP